MVRRTFLATGFPDAASVFASGGYGQGGEAESLEESRWRRWRCVCERVRRCARQRVSEKTGGKWDGGTMSARASAKRRGDRGAAACAHRRALHSACTSERCGWNARVCWCERVTGSRVRQLQPRLLVQWFSILSSSRQRSILYRTAAGSAGGNTAKAAILLLLRRIVFFIAIVRAISYKVVSNIMWNIHCTEIGSR